MSGPLPVLTPDGRAAGVLHDGAGEPAEHSPRPFLHPVSTPQGVCVSDYRPSDHPWHWGLGIAVPNVDVVARELPVNLWGGPTYREGHGYVQLPNNGSQRVRAGDRRGHAVLQLLDWRAADGAVVLAEERSWSADTVRSGGVEWMNVTVRSTWVNVSDGPIAFGSPTTAGRPDAGYGGFFLRLAPTFDGADVLIPAIGVDPRSGSRAVVGEEGVMGSAHSWLGMRSDTASVLMVPGARNPGERSWFVRSTGTPMLCAAPFFHRELHLDADGSLDWTWSLLVADAPVDGDAFATAAEAGCPPA